MISIYVAARFETQEGAKQLRDALAEHGIGCTSRWLEEKTQLGKNLPDSPENRVKFALMDSYDVRRAQALVLWNPQKKAKVGTGGCHVETGMALALGMHVYLVGSSPTDPTPDARSNIFHFLPDVRSFTWPHHVKALAERIKGDCFDFGPTWDSPAERSIRAHGACGYKDGSGVYCPRPKKLDHEYQWCEEHAGS